AALVMISYLLYQNRRLTIVQNKLIKDEREVRGNINEQIRHQPGFFDALFNNSHTGIGILSLDGKLIRVNQGLCQLFGYSEETLLTMNFYHLIHPDDFVSLQNQIQLMIDNQIKMYQSEHECFRKNNEPIW